MVIKDGAKMSKSLGNVVSPDDMVAKYGADATRMYTLFAAPPDRDLDWQDAGVEGVSRFLARVYRLVAQNPIQGATDAKYSLADLSPEAKKIARKLHQTIKRISDELGGRWHFNTCVAALMEFTNECYAVPELFANPRAGVERTLVADVQRKLALLLQPFAPYLAHELWTMLGENSNLLRAPWPQYDAALAKEDEVEIVIQVNGKMRSRVTVATDADEQTVRELALADEKVKAAIEGKEIVKVVIVPRKLVNIVVK
jgi:leucyl-tRNA synthetase